MLISLVFGILAGILTNVTRGFMFVFLNLVYG